MGTANPAGSDVHPTLTTIARYVNTLAKTGVPASNRKIAVVELFRFPTIDALAKHLTTAEDLSPERDRIQQLANRQKAAVNRMRKPADRRDVRP